MQLADEHYRLLVESVEDYAIFLLDPEGRVQSWNAGAQRIKGYAAGEIIGQHMSVFYSPQDRQLRIWEHSLGQALARGRYEDVGWRVRKDGSRFWASVVITALRDPTGDLLGFAKVTRDLTDRAYKLFLEAVDAIVWTTDVTGQPNADSPSWRAFTGQSEEEWRGRGWQAIHPDDQPALADAWLSATRAGEVFEAELRLRRHDGRYVWVSSRAVPLRDHAGNVREWFGVNVDISARKDAENERERAVERWATTLRSIGDGVIATDANGVVTFLNPVAEAHTGWAAGEAIGRPLREIFPIFSELTHEPVANPVDEVLRAGVIVGLGNHTLLRRRDGTELPIADSAAPLHRSDGGLDGVVLVFRDTRHEKLEATRRAFLAQAGDVLIAAADFRQGLADIAALAVPDLADWCAVDVLDTDAATPSRLAVAHVDPAKVEHAKQLAERYPSDPVATTGVVNVIRTGRSELYTEIPPELIERTAVDAEHLRIIRELDLRSAMIVPLRGRERVFGAWTFIYTGSRRYDEDDVAFAEELARRAAILVERRRLEEEASVANRAKDEFLAMLGHELRNPLAPIRTALDLMSLRGDPAHDKERRIIERQVGHLETLVDDLLDVSRITREKVKLERQPVEISTVINQALEMASPILEQREHHVNVDVPRTGFAVDGDRARLAQVFANLVNNAAKYTDPKGLITIEVRREDGHVVGAVTDTGIGIAPEALPWLFDPFAQEPQSIERAHGGLGLGLAIVRSLVTMHGGTVSAASAGPGRGSTFTVRLPALPPDTVALAPASRPAGLRPPSGARRILVVDDNRDAASLLVDLLSAVGYEAHAAFDGPSAIELAGKIEPDAALLDVGLPVMDGYELAQRLRASPGGERIRLVAVTGYGQESDQRRAVAAGFDRHFVKPVDIRSLYATLEELIERPDEAQ